MTQENNPAHGVFWHECEEPECEHMVQYDDEPKCYTHSPDSGSSVKGYSAFEKWNRTQADQRMTNRSLTFTVTFTNVTDETFEDLQVHMSSLLKLSSSRYGCLHANVTVLDNG